MAPSRRQPFFFPTTPGRLATLVSSPARSGRKAASLGVPLNPRSGFGRSTRGDKHAPLGKLPSSQELGYLGRRCRRTFVATAPSVIASPVINGTGWVFSMPETVVGGADRDDGLERVSVTGKKGLFVIEFEFTSKIL